MHEYIVDEARSDRPPPGAESGAACAIRYLRAHTLLQRPPTDGGGGEQEQEQGGSGDGFTFSELFAGIGGFRVGLESLGCGGRCVFSSEIAPAAKQIYRYKYTVVACTSMRRVRDWSCVCGKTILRD